MPDEATTLHSVNGMNTNEPRQLIDGFGRVHTSLRVSVTDACNIRCRYCMPETVSGFLPADRLLSFESITRIVACLAGAGIRKVRLTGGEPLMRPRLEELVESLSSVEGLQQIALTTNGMLLDRSMESLVQAGLTHLNISLDTLRESAFRQMSRRDGLDRVLAGIDAALAHPINVRLNALVLRDINFADCLPLVRFARERDVIIRFIEFMPLDADRGWSAGQVVTGAELKRLVEDAFGPLRPANRTDRSQPSNDYSFADGVGGIGFIDPVSEPFCDSCNRLRLTADGKFRNCLFGQEEWDVRPALEASDRDAAIFATAVQCVSAKFASHGISKEGFQPPERAMYQIGG